MSGVEALAVIGVIANIINLTEFSRNIISQIKKYGENAQEVPDAFRDIQAVLPLISSTLIRTRNQVQCGTLDDDTCKVLRPVLEGCQNKMEQLKAIFRDVMAEEGTSKFKRGLMAIKSIRKDKEVKEIAQALDRYVAHLTHYHVSEGVTSREIESLKGAMSSLSVEQLETQSPKTHFLVPVQWSDDFAGRKEVMEFLDSRLCLEDRHSRVALVGLGGMGKTRIALEYAKKFKKSDQISVFWVYAGTVERFRNAYREIARKLKIPGCQSSESDILRIVKDWLENKRSGRWLMVLDNADDAEIMYGSGSIRLAKYFPKSDQGSILLTTRFQKVGASFASPRNVINLQLMTLIESELLLRARLGDERSKENHIMYQELAKELERTPLALVQAASFMSQNCIPLDMYLRMYHESDMSKIRLLSEDFEDDIRDSDAKNPIATTWIISFDYIRLHVPQAAELLSLMSIMDAQNIPEFLMPQGEDAISFNKAIGTLEAFGFISTKKQLPGPIQQHRLFDLHRLVRLAIRNWLKMNNTLDQRTAQVLKLLATFCLRAESESFDISNLMIPHAIELLESDLLQCRSSSSQQLLELKHEDKPSLGDLHSISKTTSTQVRETIDLLENVDTIARLLICTADLLDYVTFRFREVGNYVEARSFGAKSLLVNTLVFGESHYNTLSVMRVLATMLHRVGECEHAEQLRRRVVTLCESEYGLLHTFTLDALLELRNFLALEVREQEAIETCEIGIQRCQESLLIHQGEEHLEILLKLADFQLENGDFGEAESSALLALRGCEAANDDSNVITALEHLSKTFEKQDKLGLAVDTRRTGLDSSIRYWGPHHSYTLNTRWDLVRILLKDQRLEEARRQASLALEPISQVYGSSSDVYAYHYGEFDELFSRHGGLICPHRTYDDNQLALSMAENNTIIANIAAS